MLTFFLYLLYTIIIGGAFLALIGYASRMVHIVKGNAPLERLFDHQLSIIGSMMTYGGLAILIILILIF